MPLVIAATDKTLASKRTGGVGAPAAVPMGGIHGVDKKDKSITEIKKTSGGLLSNARVDVNGNTGAVAIQNGSIISKYNELVNAGGKCSDEIPGAAIAQPDLHDGIVGKAVAKTGWQQKLQTSKSAHNVRNTARDDDSAKDASTSSRNSSERRPSLIDSIINKFSNTGPIPSRALLKPAAKRDANKVEISSKFQQSAAGVPCSIFAERFKRADILEQKDVSKKECTKGDVPGSKNGTDAPATKVEPSTPQVKYSFNGSVLANGQPENAHGVSKNSTEVRAEQSKTSNITAPDESLKSPDRMIVNNSTDVTQKDRTMKIRKSKTATEINKTSTDGVQQQTNVEVVESKTNVSPKKTFARVGNLESAESKSGKIDRIENENRSSDINAGVKIPREEIQLVKHDINSKMEKNAAALEIDKKTGCSEMHAVEKQSESRTVAKLLPKEIDSTQQNAGKNIYTCKSTSVNKSVAEQSVPAAKIVTGGTVVPDASKKMPTDSEKVTFEQIKGKASTEINKSDAVGLESTETDRVQIKKAPISRFLRSKLGDMTAASDVINKTDLTNQIAETSEKTSITDVTPGATLVSKNDIKAENLAVKTDSKNIHVGGADLTSITDTKKTTKFVTKSTGKLAEQTENKLEVKTAPKINPAEKIVKTSTFPTSSDKKEIVSTAKSENIKTSISSETKTESQTTTTTTSTTETSIKQQTSIVDIKKSHDGETIDANSKEKPTINIDNQSVVKKKHKMLDEIAKKFETRVDLASFNKQATSKIMSSNTKTSTVECLSENKMSVDEKGKTVSVKESIVDLKARTEHLINDIANNSGDFGNRVIEKTDSFNRNKTAVKSTPSLSTKVESLKDSVSTTVDSLPVENSSSVAAQADSTIGNSRSDINNTDLGTKSKTVSGEDKPKVKIVRKKISTVESTQSVNSQITKSTTNETSSASHELQKTETNLTGDNSKCTKSEPPKKTTNEAEKKERNIIAAETATLAEKLPSQSKTNTTTMFGAQSIVESSRKSNLARSDSAPSSGKLEPNFKDATKKESGAATGSAPIKIGAQIGVCASNVATSKQTNKGDSFVHIPTTVVDFRLNERSAVNSAADGSTETRQSASSARSVIKDESRACEITEPPDRAGQNNVDSAQCKLSVSEVSGECAAEMKSKIKQKKPAANGECAKVPARGTKFIGEPGNNINNPLNVVIIARSNQCIQNRDHRISDTRAEAHTSVPSDKSVDSMLGIKRSERENLVENEKSSSIDVAGKTEGRTFIVHSKISENLIRDSAAFANSQFDAIGSKKNETVRIAPPLELGVKVDRNAGDTETRRLAETTILESKKSKETDRRENEGKVRGDGIDKTDNKIGGIVETDRRKSVVGGESVSEDGRGYMTMGLFSKPGDSMLTTESKCTEDRQRRSPSNSSVSSTDTITSNYESVASSSYDTATSSMHRMLPPLPKRTVTTADRFRRCASDSVRDTTSQQDGNARSDATFFRKSAPDSFLRRGSPIPSTRPGGRVTTGKLIISRSPSPISSRASTGIGSMSRSVSPSSRASSLSSSDRLTTDRSSTPRRIFPQLPAKAGLDELMNKEQSPVVYDANMSFVIGCKSQIRQNVKSTAAHLDSTTASNYLSTKITDFLKRTDHVMDEWKHSGHRGNNEDDFPKSEEERILFGKSKSAANIAIKGYTMFSQDRSRHSRTRSKSRSRSSSMMSDLFNDGDTYSECDELSEMTADLAEEHSTATLATERLDAETSERLRLERELSEVQTKNKSLQQTSERLEMELLYARSDLNGLASDEEEDGEVDGGAYKQKYERTLRELEFTKRRLQQQHEDDLEQLVGLKKQLEKKLADAYEEVEEQRQVVGQWKRKVQKHVSEMNDLRLLLEEQNSRNNLLEKKQRKFDSETQLLQDELRQEKQARERVSREKEVILAEKYTIESSLADVRLELELKDERLRSLQQEIDDLTFGGKEDEVATLRKQKQDCERRLHEQEEELDDLAGQVQILEQAKVRLEMSLEQQKKEAKRESQQREDELEEVRGNAQKKVKALEAQLENEHEERTLLLREKHSLERRLATIAEEGRTEKEGDEAQLQRLKRDLKRTKALLRDAQTMLERAKADNPGKAVIRQLRNQLDDLECARAAAVKSKQSLETELSELQSQLDEAHRQKSEAEDRANTAVRERMDLRTQVEENEEELAEVLKKYRSAVQQLSMDQMALQEQMSLVSDLESERNSLKEQLAEMASKLETRETMDDSSTNVQTKRMELRVKELESKLEFEQTTRARLEVQITRLKETVDKLQTDISHSRVREQTAQDNIRKLQRSLRELKDEHTALIARESESAQKRKEVEKKFESAEAETAAAKSDLRLALQRIEDLQAAIQGELEDTTSDHSDSEHDSYSSDESIESFLANHKLSPVKTVADRSSLQLDSSPRSVERNNVRLNSTSSPAKSSFA